MMKLFCSTALWLSTTLLTINASFAETYELDPTHSFVEFRVKHLGFSWLHGRFNDISGTFDYTDKAVDKSKIDVLIKTTSLDSNHAERDKHLRGSDFLNTEKFPTAAFKSTSFDGKTLKGDLTLHGVTKPIEIAVTKIGEGKDPWGGYRAGFSGTAEIQRSEFGIKYNLGPTAETVVLELGIEGVMKK